MAAYLRPGNVRGLRNLIELLVLLSHEALIRPTHLPLEMSTAEIRAIQVEYQLILGE